MEGAATRMPPDRADPCAAASVQTSWPAATLPLPEPGHRASVRRCGNRMCRAFKALQRCRGHGGRGIDYRVVTLAADRAGPVSAALGAGPARPAGRRCVRLPRAATGSARTAGLAQQSHAASLAGHRFVARLRSAALAGAAARLRQQPAVRSRAALHCDFDALPFPEPQPGPGGAAACAGTVARPAPDACAKSSVCWCPRGASSSSASTRRACGACASAAATRAALSAWRAGPLFLPRAGEFLGYWRLRDWLRLLSFEVDGGRFGCYRPPLPVGALARAVPPGWRASVNAGGRCSARCTC